MNRTVLLEKLIVPQLVQKFPTFNKTHTFITMHTTQQYNSLPLAAITNHINLL
jgi:hypothetical protein